MLPIRENETWSVANAKSKLSAVIERAQTAPQVITCHGKPAAVIVSIDEWTRKTQRKTSLVEFLRNSPLVGEDLNLERIRDEPREITF